MNLIKKNTFVLPKSATSTNNCNNITSLSYIEPIKLLCMIHYYKLTLSMTSLWRHNLHFSPFLPLLFVRVYAPNNMKLTHKHKHSNSQTITQTPRYKNKRTYGNVHVFFLYKQPEKDLSLKSCLNFSRFLRSKLLNLTRKEYKKA